MKSDVAGTVITGISVAKKKSQEQLNIQNYFISICVDTYMKTNKQHI